MLRHRSLVMLFTDLFADPEPVIHALRRLRHGGHDVILFHILDEAEVRFPFDGMIEFEEPETHEKLQIDAGSFRPDYLSEIAAFAITTAANASRPASTTCRSTPACSSIGP